MSDESARRWWRRLALRAGRAWVHGALAGMAIGVIELGRMFGTAPVLALAPVAVGLSTLAALALALPLLALTGALGKAPFLRAWWREVREPGPPRVAALVRLLVAAVALGGFWFASFAMAVWAHGRFQARGAAGVLIATGLTVALIAIVIGAAALGPALARWVSRRAMAQRATRGAPGAALLAVVGLGLGAALVVFSRRAAPAYDWRPAYMAGGFLIALGIAEAADAARRLGRRGAASVGAMGLLLAIGGMLQVSASDRARQAVASRGTSSLATLRALWRLSDRDGDGFASAFGGADCDDGDRSVNPGAVEIAGNGKDDNCAGGDLSGDDVEARVRAEPSAHPDAPRRNVLILSIDALRADHVGAYGYARPTTPIIDALAARGARFEWATSPSPTTRRAIPALMTGRYASTIAFKDSGWPPVVLPKRHVMLGEVFKAAGYQTRAVHCCAALFDKASGVIAGIDEVDATAAKVQKTTPHTAGHIAGLVSKWIRDRKADPRPFFLWMHFLDPHNPYSRPPGAPDFGRGDMNNYDSEVAYADAQLGVILAALEETGELADTIVVIAADHGDEFMEHGNRYHGRSLYAELVRVPLIVAVPGGEARVIAEPVSLVDIGATVLDLVGLPRPAGQNGRSLGPAVLGEGPAPDRTVLAELIADRNITRNLKAALYGDWKLIWDLDASTYELYSLRTDPGDRTDVLDDHPEVVADMKQRLHEAADQELSLLPGEKPRQEAGKGKEKRPAKAR